MIDRVELKKRAKELAFNNKWNIWKPLLLYFVASFVVGFILGIVVGILRIPKQYIPIFECIAVLALAPMLVGLASYFIKFVNKKDVDAKEELLSRYKDGSTFPIIKVVFLVGLFIGLWSLLFVIPGIVYAVATSMTMFILAEQSLNEINDKPAYKVSKEMMNGHKWEYFVFQLSFILWIIGVEFTFGILAIWVVPYMTVANVMWFEELKKLSK